MHFRRTKTLSIISHDNYNLNAIEDFVKLSLPSKLHALLTVSLWNKNPGQLLVYSMKRNIYIGFWTLKVKCTYYEMCGEMTFKNARAMDFFLKSSMNFGGVHKSLICLWELPLPVSTYPERLGIRGTHSRGWSGWSGSNGVELPYGVEGRFIRIWRH